MKYKALISFTGKISKIKGEIFEINDEYIEKDLLQAKYIAKVTEKSKKEVKVNED